MKDKKDNNGTQIDRKKLGKFKRHRHQNSKDLRRNIFKKNHPHLATRDKRGLSSPEAVLPNSTCLSKSPRRRANTAQPAICRKDQLPIEQVLLSCELVTVINQFHTNLIAGKKTEIKAKQLDLFHQYCSKFTLANDTNLLRICAAKPLTPYLYQQILSRLRQDPASKPHPISKSYTKNLARFLKWYDNCNLDSLPSEPKYTELSNSINSQKPLQLLWKLTTKKVKYNDRTEDLTVVEFADALTGLCYKYKFNSLILGLYKLIPYMNRDQIRIAQIIAYHHANEQTNEITDAAKKTLLDFRKRIIKQDCELNKPNFDKISNSTSLQKRMHLLWQFTAEHLGKRSSDLADKVFNNELVTFCNITTPSTMIRTVNKLIPFMSQQQLNIATHIIRQLQNHKSNDFSERAKKRLSVFQEAISLRKKELNKQPPLLWPEFSTFVNRCQISHQFFLYKNINCLEKSFQQSLKNSELITFTDLFDKGIKSSDKISPEIASELIKCSTYFYQSLLFSKQPKEKLFYRYSIFYNNLSQMLIRKLRLIDDDKFVASIHLLVMVGNQLSYLTNKSSFADLNSLLLLNLVFQNSDVSKKIKIYSNSIIKSDRNFIKELASTTSVINNFAGLKEMASRVENHIPYLGLISRELQYSQDGNPDICMSLAIVGKIIKNLKLTGLKLSEQTVFLNSTILTEMLDVNLFSTSKKSGHNQYDKTIKQRNDIPRISVKSLFEKENKVTANEQKDDFVSQGSISHK